MKDNIEYHLTNATIMMVDDEPINMEVIQAFLEDEGYSKFILVEKSAEAMNIMEEKRPDILLLDLMMPEVSGFDILSEVRVHPKFEHLPILVLTSSTDTETKLRALDLGATDFLAKPVDPSELGLRVRNTLAAKAYLDQLAYYDPLTKLPNRQLFLERFDWAMKEAKRHRDQLAILNIEMDNFDRINDTLGMSAGDEVLRLIVPRIERVIRSSDILGHFNTEEDEIMHLFKMEGNVFSLLMDRTNGTESTALVAERIIKAIRAPFPLQHTEVYVTASIGIASFPAESQDSVELLRLASSAKDYAKSKGGDSFQFSSDSINELYLKRHELETGLRKSMERDELVLFYQPKVDIKTGEITGVEALLRWNNGSDRLITPDEFIPLAEETGLIIPMGEWVINEACMQLKEWHNSDRIPINMSVNLSSVQFSDPEFFTATRQIIEKSGIDTKYLTLEITESLLIDDVENKIKMLEKFKDIGLKLSIDDFGTGYSSFNYLRRLPVNELKIDRAFIMDLAENSDSHAIVSSMIFLSHSLGMITVAEGIETEEQMRILQEEQCDQYQGYYFSRPIPGEELFKLLPKKS